ncbi:MULTISPECIES: hypothetical protein [Pseudomonas]|uniref:Uncharacterized protein n=1 Tax=Pseudomonas fluorescens TaxID=294 RepID=A0A160A555_PSEFL|nr:MULTISPECIES: hypothetical protein [Pseudomonas]AMZ74801.1 hypothetical protein TK06_28140 [Pseudomonas fluorescens]SDB60957.1 hypothetical protein SAMN03159386_04860 [Pseudomonas sp. NFACC17-2]SEJ86614.1 hypothetical protein SAMN03159382_04882 [Pseudomonas sp. NFACC23-1]SFW91736.1 hypothetical protein SAMN05660640_05237 [Pseudomonas sp. NFACC16-2]
MSISDSDWKSYNELYDLALERFCQGVLADAQTIAQSEALSAHARYRTLYRLMRNRDKDLAMAFNVSRRRDVSLSLRLMIAYDLLSDQELAVLSEELRERVSDAVRQPFEIEWAEDT